MNFALLDRLPLRVKPWVITGGFMSVATLVWGVGYWLSARQTVQTMKLAATLITVAQASDTTRQSQADFKTQVQDWKDMLLRGHAPAMMAKYRNGFEQDEKNVQADFQKLMGQMEELGISSDPVKEAIEEHKLLGQRYRDAMATWNASDPLAYRSVDSKVKGMDRPMSAAIGELSAAILKESDQIRTHGLGAMANLVHWNEILQTMLLLLGLIVSAVMARDIALRKRMERERAGVEIQLLHSQKLKAIGQLAAGIAHEINTPTQYIGDNTAFLQDSFAHCMAIIRTLAGHLAQIRDRAGPDAGAAVQALATLETEDLGYLEEEIPKAIKETLEGVARVSGIVGAMKDFSHPGVEAISSIDLHRAIQSTIIVSRSEWKSVAELQTEFASNLPLVPCYPGEINQVVLNLIVNAAHAIADRKQKQNSAPSGLIKIGTCLSDQEVEVWVSDNGAGVPPEIQGRIFDPFFTTKPVGKGSGQGLAIVHGVITGKHKGRVTLESTLGSGTTFRIFLPLGTSEA